MSVGMSVYEFESKGDMFMHERQYILSPHLRQISA